MICSAGTYRSAFSFSIIILSIVDFPQRRTPVSIFTIVLQTGILYIFIMSFSMPSTGMLFSIHVPYPAFCKCSQMDSLIGVKSPAIWFWLDQPYTKWAKDPVIRTKIIPTGYLQNIYPKYFGTTCLNEVIESRIQYACELLFSTHMMT